MEWISVDKAMPEVEHMTHILLWIPTFEGAKSTIKGHMECWVQYPDDPCHFPLNVTHWMIPTPPEATP